MLGRGGNPLGTTSKGTQKRRGSGSPVASNLLTGLQPSTNKSGKTPQEIIAEERAAKEAEELEEFLDKELQFKEYIEDNFSGDPSKDAFLRSEGKGIVYSLYAKNGTALIKDAEAGSLEEAKKAIEEAKQTYQEEVLAERKQELEEDKQNKQLIEDYKKKGIDLTTLHGTIYNQMRLNTETFLDEVTNKKAKEEWMEIETLPGGNKILIYSRRWKRGECPDSGRRWKRGECPDSWSKKPNSDILMLAFDAKGKFIAATTSFKEKERFTSFEKMEKPRIAELKEKLKKIMVEVFAN